MDAEANAGLLITRRMIGNDLSASEPKVDANREDPPLFVDLDETLSRTDLLWEALLILAKTEPLTLLAAPVWLMRGKACFKQRVAEQVNLDPALLAYHQPFLDYLKDEAATGRRLILATAAPERWAGAVAKYLGIFQGVLSSTGQCNLTGNRKLLAILEQCPDGRFDYAGNASIDLQIWAKARAAIVVNASNAVLHAAEKSARVSRVFEAPQGGLARYVKAMRVHQWLKNLLVFVPLVTAHLWFSPTALKQSILAFIAFSLTASSLYVMNDLLDLGADRVHPRKRLRPFAAGDIALNRGVALVILLFAVGIACGVVLSWQFLAVLVAYAVITTAYSIYLKVYTLIDVLLLAALYTVRVIAGSVATMVVPTFWLLAFSMFTFFSLALLKRYTELLALREINISATRGRDYNVTDLALLANMGSGSGCVATLVLALFINSPDLATRYSRPYALWVLCPLFLYWISRLWLKAGRGEMHDDPLIYAVKDRGSRYVFAAMLLSLICAL
jgi:4-hydroxybenzoate polyprenyltransferase